MRPKISSELLSDRCLPDCPHCGGGMEGASITLEELREALPLPDWVRVDRDGFAPAASGGLKVACPACTRMSVLACDDVYIKLVACRTEADERLLAGRG